MKKYLFGIIATLSVLLFTSNVYASTFTVQNVIENAFNQEYIDELKFFNIDLSYTYNNESGDIVVYYDVNDIGNNTTKNFVINFTSKDNIIEYTTDYREFTAENNEQLFLDSYITGCILQEILDLYSYNVNANDFVESQELVIEGNIGMKDKDGFHLNGIYSEFKDPNNGTETKGYLPIKVTMNLNEFTDYNKYDQSGNIIKDAEGNAESLNDGSTINPETGNNNHTVILLIGLSLATIASICIYNKKKFY